MDVAREHGRDLTEDSLDALAHQLLVVGPPRLVPSPRAALALHGERHAVKFPRRVLRRVVGVTESMNNSLPAGRQSGRTPSPRTSEAEPGRKANSTGTPSSVVTTCTLTP